MRHGSALLHTPSARIGAGVLLTLLGLACAGALAHATLVLAPFAATAALKHAAPHGPLARPRNVLGGYAIGTVAGVTAGLLITDPAVGAALGAAVAATAMARLDVEHPPAVAMTVVAVQQPVAWVLQAAAVGAVLITVTTVLLAPVLHRSTYPAGAGRFTRRFAS